MQETLFEVEHVHQYETFHGPIKTNGVIQTSYRGHRWCWTCSEGWIELSPEEEAEFYAREIKKGNATRKECIDQYCFWRKTTFHEAVLAIDIAIGNLNEGVK